MFNWCKFRRVQGKVFYRLQRNMEKKFGIIVGNTADIIEQRASNSLLFHPLAIFLYFIRAIFLTADLRFSAYVGKAFTIDPNYTEAVFRYRDKPIMISLSIFDNLLSFYILSVQSFLHNS